VFWLLQTLIPGKSDEQIGGQLPSFSAAEIQECEPRKLTMGITLDLLQELESELAAEAPQLWLSLTEYALHLLVTRTRAGHMPVTGAELVAYW
jgi:hypothetical protein